MSAQAAGAGHPAETQPSVRQRREDPSPKPEVKPEPPKKDPAEVTPADALITLVAPFEKFSIEPDTSKNTHNP